MMKLSVNKYQTNKSSKAKKNQKNKDKIRKNLKIKQG